MAASEVIVSSASGLVGVGLGSWLALRSASSLAKRAERQALRKDLQGTFTSVGAAFASFSRYVRNENFLVELVDRPEDGKQTEVIRSSSVAPPRPELDSAMSGLRISVADDSEVELAAVRLRKLLWDLIRSRASYQTGAIPNADLEPFIRAQQDFADAARRHLQGL